MFRDRGLASIRRADNGILLLDTGLVPLTNRIVRVRVRENGRIVGRSKVPSNSDVESAEGRILQARDSIFEEELFYELVREARVMASQGVTTRQNEVQISVAGERDILLDLVDVEEEDDAEPVSDYQDILAEGLSHLIHILLSYSHRQNLRRRMQIPPPLTPKKKQIPEYQLLRPTMAYLQHSSHVQWLQSFLADIYGVLNSAGLNCEYSTALFSSARPPQEGTFSTPRAESLIEQLLQPLETTATSKLIVPNSKLMTKIHTNLTGPPFGTNYEFSVNLASFHDIKPTSRIGLRDDLSAIITHMILLDIVSAISISSNNSQQHPLKWEAVYPHHGELLASSPTADTIKKMKITVSRDMLKLQTHYVRGTGNYGPQESWQGAEESFTWGGAESEKSSFMDIVAQVSN